MQGRRMGWGVAFVAAAALIALAANAGAVSIRGGDLVIAATGSVRPTRLSPTVLSPISFTVGAAVRTLDSTPLPAMETFSFDADRQGEFFTRGLATCAPSRLASTTPAEAMRVCGDALVGSGSTSAVLSFPEQKPYTLSAPLLMFNGGSRGGRTLLVMQVYASRPVPTTFVVLGVVTKTTGRYGTNTLVRIPTIADGYGSLKSFKVRIHRNWRYRRKERSFLIARCATGRFYAHAAFTFNDGTAVSGTLAKRCAQRG